MAPDYGETEKGDSQMTTQTQTQTYALDPVHSTAEFAAPGPRPFP